jgi:uncharacterized protein YceH (UPF0502 family)
VFSDETDPTELQVLDEMQLRVLGCLIEKERTTPTDYPLTANSIMRAANQTTSRDPIVEYDINSIEGCLDGLKDLRLVAFVHSPSNRARKFRQRLDEQLSLSNAEVSLLALLMLRGPQTAGELRTRSERLCAFDSLEAVLTALQGLTERAPALAVELPRLPGQKDTRFVHLLGGPVDVDAYATARHEPRRTTSGTAEQLEQLQTALHEAQAEIAGLRARVDRLETELGLEGEAVRTTPARLDAPTDATPEN